MVLPIYLFHRGRWAPEPKHVVEQSPRHSTPHTAKSQMPIVVYNAEFAITWQHGLEFFYVFFFVKIILMFFLFFFSFFKFCYF